MGIERRRKVIGVSVLSFAVFFSAVTGLRAWNLEPPVSVQSLIVNGVALLVVAASAYHVFRGGDFVESWILAFGPSLAFSLILFIPIHRGGLLALFGYALVTAVLLSGALGSLGFSTGYVARKLTTE